jgi:hypothetical protein
VGAAVVLPAGHLERVVRGHPHESAVVLRAGGHPKACLGYEGSILEISSLCS